MTHASVYVTCPDAETAKRIARGLLEARLVACANILPASSLYWWDGAIQEDAETVMFLKTREALLDSVIAKAREMHPYEVPCVVALPINNGDPRYLSWIDGETGAPDSV